MDVARAQTICGYAFNNIRLLEEALQVAGLSIQAPEGNKRLAQLGNAVLTELVLDGWYSTPDSCGIGNQLVSRIVSQDHIVRVARNSGIDGCIQTNPSQGNDVVSPKVLLNTLLAVIAAIWRDSGRDSGVVRAVLRGLDLTE